MIQQHFDKRYHQITCLFLIFSVCAKHESIPCFHVACDVFYGKCCINKIIIIFDKKLSFLSLLLPSNFTSFHFSRPKTEKKRTQSMLVVHCYEYLSLLSVLLWATHYSTGSPTNNFQRVEVDINAEGMVSYILQIFLRFSVSSFIVVSNSFISNIANNQSKCVWQRKGFSTQGKFEIGRCSRLRKRKFEIEKIWGWEVVKIFYRPKDREDFGLVR